MKLSKEDSERVSYEHEFKGMDAAHILKYVLAFRKKHSLNLARKVWVLCQDYKKECPQDVFEFFLDDIKGSIKDLEVLTADENYIRKLDEVDEILDKRVELIGQGVSNPVEAANKAIARKENTTVGAIKKRMERVVKEYNDRYPDN